MALSRAGRDAGPSSEAEIPAALPTPTTAAQRADRVIVTAAQGRLWLQSVIHFPCREAGGPERGVRGRGPGQGRRPLWGALFSRPPARAASQARPARRQPEARLGLLSGSAFFPSLSEGGVRGACRAQCPRAPPSRLRGSRHLDPRRALVGSKEQPRPLGPFRRPRPPAHRLAAESPLPQEPAPISCPLSLSRH